MEETNDSTPEAAAAATDAMNVSSKVAWFEFILDETLLERHLSDPNAGKSRRYWFFIELFQNQAGRFKEQSVVAKCAWSSCVCLCLDPPAAELVALFLYQADVTSSIVREIASKENVPVNGTQTAADSSAQYDGSLWLTCLCIVWNNVGKSLVYCPPV